MQPVLYGNLPAKQLLSGVLKTGRICHAYLITGDAGLGKRTFARLFAKALLCKTPPGDRADGLPCDKCGSCHKADTHNHPDLITLSGKQAKNSIHIDRIRALRQDAFLRPNESVYKIYIIEQAENLSAGAANALLKVLEEPPAHAIFLLTAVSAAALYDTIVSRCIEISMRPVDGEQVRAALESDPDLHAEPAALRRAERLCDGNIGAAKQMLSDSDSAAQYDAAARVVDALISRREYDLLRALQGCGKDRASIKAAFGFLLGILRRAIVSDCDPTDEQDPAARLAQAVSRTELMRIADLVTDGCARIDKNANTALLLSYIAAKIKS